MCFSKVLGADSEGSSVERQAHIRGRAAGVVSNNRLRSHAPEGREDESSDVLARTKDERRTSRSVNEQDASALATSGCVRMTKDGRRQRALGERQAREMGPCQVRQARQAQVLCRWTGERNLGVEERGDRGC